MSKIKSYYLKVLSNLDSNNHFYKYYNTIYTYRDFKNYSVKLACYIEKYFISKKKNQSFLHIQTNPLRCMHLYILFLFRNQFGFH